MIYLDSNSTDITLRYSANILISGKKINLFFDKRERGYVIDSVGDISLEVESYQELEKFIFNLYTSFASLSSDCFAQEKNIKRELSQENFLTNNEDKQIEHAIKAIKHINNNETLNKK